MHCFVFLVDLVVACRGELVCEVIHCRGDVCQFEGTANWHVRYSFLDGDYTTYCMTT